MDQDNPRLEELLEFFADEGASANVASFEYGINDAVPHSRGGELLCPGNNIDEGFVRLDLTAEFLIESDYRSFNFAGIFIGLNNGNGRGSLDSIWFANPRANPL